MLHSSFLPFLCWSCFTVRALYFFGRVKKTAKRFCLKVASGVGGMRRVSRTDGATQQIPLPNSQRTKNLETIFSNGLYRAT